jgi:hypothetical protein
VNGHRVALFNFARNFRVKLARFLGGIKGGSDKGCLSSKAFTPSGDGFGTP